VLTLVQQVPLSGGVIVTTPQDVALLDVARGMAMLRQVSTPVLGVVENMATYVCPACGAEDAVFGAGGAERLAAHFDVPLLARIPLALAVREGGDHGRPVVAADPAHPASQTFRALAARVATAVRGTPRVPVAGVSA
jgi:ATP-binding protein involved in chromosome partitioning